MQMTWYQYENPKTTRTDKFNKISGYNIGIQKSDSFLYSSKEMLERERFFFSFIFISWRLIIL